MLKFIATNHQTKWLLSCLLALCCSTALAQADTDIVINEVFYQGDSSSDWIELKNTGSSLIDISGWWFCSRFNYRAVNLQTILVGDDYILQPGEIIVLSAGFDLDADLGADINLYINESFGNPNSMVDFLQWVVATRVGRSNEAIQRNFWSGDVPAGFVDFIDGAAAGQSTAFCGVNSGGGLLTLSSDFANSAPSMGIDNDGNCLEESFFASGFESGI